MHPESKLQFDKAAAAFGLAPAQRDLAWRRIGDLGLSPDDPTVVYLAVAGLLEHAAQTIPAAIETLPARVEEAARRAVGPVAEAASTRVEAAHAVLAERTGEAVSEAAIRHFAAADRARDLGINLRLIALVGAVALTCGVTGWALGRANVSGLATQWAALAARTDAADWLNLAAANPNLSLNLRAYCGPGGIQLVPSQHGKRVCNVPLWLEGSSPPSSGAAQGVYVGLLDWLAGWGPLWLLGGGLLAGLMGRKLLRTFVQWRPIAWILD